jgi:hypothetical protein
MFWFCTYLDQNYLARGLALYQSLRDHCPSFALWILCMDSESLDILHQLDLPDIHCIALQDLEHGDERLAASKKDRSKIEYYFTCTPSLPLYILRKHPELPAITYLDADLFFYDNPSELFQEMGGHSIAIISHRYAPNLTQRYKYGIYNVGWVTFKNDANALLCLNWWRERCIEWCYDKVEDDRYADQKYLDQWPQLFNGVIPLQHKGANVAPWNIANYHFSFEGNKIWADQVPLLFYHFHGFRQVTRWLYDPNLALSRVKLNRKVKQHLFVPYIQALKRAQQLYAPMPGKARLPVGIRAQLNSMTFADRIRHVIDKVACSLISATHSEYLIVRNGRIW